MINFSKFGMISFCYFIFKLTIFGANSLHAQTVENLNYDYVINEYIFITPPIIDIETQKFKGKGYNPFKENIFDKIGIDQEKIQKQKRIDFKGEVFNFYRPQNFTFEGECIDNLSVHQLCDGQKDCEDGSDESGCKESCDVNYSKWCDGVPDCYIGIDESDESCQVGKIPNLKTKNLSTGVTSQGGRNDSDANITDILKLVSHILSSSQVQSEINERKKTCVLNCQESEILDKYQKELEEEFNSENSSEERKAEIKNEFNAANSFLAGGRKYLADLVKDNKIDIRDILALVGVILGRSCGDSILMTWKGEECDDGNNIDGDGCSKDCRLEIKEAICGNFQIESGEDCDDGNTLDGDSCPSDCIILNKRCGDGFLSLESGEECDDGNITSGDGCSSECYIEYEIGKNCGNGVTERGEECDDGNLLSGDGCNAECKLECGDGDFDDDFSDGYVEECDDGNLDGGDGCSSSCYCEFGSRYIDSSVGLLDANGNGYKPEQCLKSEGEVTEAKYCGDGLLDLELGEECDDGNDDDSDSCTNQCKKNSQKVYESVIRNMIFGKENRYDNGIELKLLDAKGEKLEGVHCDIWEGEIGDHRLFAKNQDGILIIHPEYSTSVLELSCYKKGFKNLKTKAQLKDGIFKAKLNFKPGVGMFQDALNPDILRIHAPKVELETAEKGFAKIKNRKDTFVLRMGDDFWSQAEVPVHNFILAVPEGVEKNYLESILKSSEVRNMTQVFSGKILRPIQKQFSDKLGQKEIFHPFRYSSEIYYNDEIINNNNNISCQAIVSDKNENAVMDSNGTVLYQCEVPICKSFQNNKSFECSEEIEFNISSIHADSSGSKCLRTVPDILHPEFERRSENVTNLAQERYINEYEGKQLWRSSANLLALTKNICFVQVAAPNFKSFLGARFVIVTPSKFLDHAKMLKEHKINNMGISTVIYELEDTDSLSVRKTKTKNYLKYAYDFWFVKPRWLLLLGDTDEILTHYDLNNSYDGVPNGGDMWYGQLSGVGSTDIPDLGIGRFPVKNLDEANIMTERVISFEKDPPGKDIFLSALLNNNFKDIPLVDPYYYNFLFAARFQDNNSDGKAERWFTETAEDIKDHIKLKGMKIERDYDSESGENPQKYYDGTDIPTFDTDLDGVLDPVGIPLSWDVTSSTDIEPSLDTSPGKSIFFHRGHGWWTAMDKPTFSMTNIDGLETMEQNRFPIVFSVNCASGIFDNEQVSGYGVDPDATYFGESFIRSYKDKGALAFVGDTRSSHTRLNNDMSKGMFDALFPDYQDFGTLNKVCRLGDLLNHAKGYVANQGWGLTDLRQELTIYNVLGDPTLCARTQKPMWMILKIPTEIPNHYRLKFEPLDLDLYDFSYIPREFLEKIEEFERLLNSNKHVLIKYKNLEGEIIEIVREIGTRGVVLKNVSEIIEVRDLKEGISAQVIDVEL